MEGLPVGMCWHVRSHGRALAWMEGLSTWTWLEDGGLVQGSYGCRGIWAATMRCGCRWV
ncbi:hypothetical protein VFPBJ_02286 [Purpureocillium lilacinum]|uniref:Uncharacterized protein n=1 Tax=Purpureocillium lilacinum TaxID=33203 RepID=A0A179H1F0_PURLI|nr:hypothetical protein VFPBJ_02286 [Purpureocillium lilacinum]